jgi:hypothetical protein
VAAVARLKVSYLDGRTVEALAGPRAQVATERHFGKSFQEIGQTGSVEAIYFLAWAALHFAGKESQDFDHFLDSIEGVEDASVSPANPTEEGQQ